MSRRNKVMKCLHSGMGGNEVYKPTFAWYDRMLFLIPHIATRSSKSNLDMNTTCSSDDSQVTLPDDSVKFDDNGMLTVYEEENTDNQSCTSQPAASTSGTS
ncbi:uncharacterized protein [Anabrus simplex]|uniref:uncharacterized protein n=1 Tax=Anabrus simplex TaxID=316456 RepID=UPI0035A38A9C